MIYRTKPHLLLVVGLIASLFVFSCGNTYEKKVSGKTIVPPQDVIQINWIGNWLNEGNKEKLIREEANEYEFLHQNIKINLKFPEDIYGSAGEPEAKFLEEQVNKPLADWDIVRNKFIDAAFAEKYFVDFNEIPGFTESHKSFIKNKAYIERFNGRFYGPLIEGQVAVLFVNTEVAKKMGITVKQFDMTFDDFLGYIKAADEYNKTHPKIIPIFEYDWAKTELIFKILFFSLMDNFEEASVSEITEKKLAAIEQCYLGFEQLSKFKPIEKDWKNHKWTEENDFILNDNCLFFPNFFFMYNIWEKDSKEKMQKIMPCELPVYRPSTTYIGGYNECFVVLKNAPHKDEAIKILMNWCRPELAEKWMRYTKGSTGVTGNLTKTAFGTDQFENYMYTIDKKYDVNLIGDREMGPFINGKDGTLPLRVQDVLNGNITAKEAFEEFKKNVVY